MSAAEYLITYGWMLLVVCVVGVLFTYLTGEESHREWTLDGQATCKCWQDIHPACECRITFNNETAKEDIPTRIVCPAP